jgi:hypothetical protein
MFCCGQWHKATEMNIFYFSSRNMEAKNQKYRFGIKAAVK